MVVGWTEKELATIGFDLGDGASKPTRKSRAKNNTTPPAPTAAVGQPAAAAPDATT